MADLQQRTGIVTGAAGGLGSASAAALATAGARVLLVDRDAEGVARLVEDLARDGREAESFAADITDADDVRRMTDYAMSLWGRIDILHNNAGIFRAEGPLPDADMKIWDLVHRVNLIGSVHVAQHAIPHMVDGGGGSIINMSSAHARLGDAAWTSYQTAKAGVEALTRSIATQYGVAGVRCNAISPGLIDTPNAVGQLPDVMVRRLQEQNLLGRLGLPQEIADVVVFLASDRASFITGQIIAVDGGLSMHMPHARDLLQPPDADQH